MTPLQWVQIGLSTAYTCTGLVLFVAVCVAAVVHRDQVRQHWTTGLAVSTLVLLLSAPSDVLTVMHLDVFAVLGDMDLPQAVRDNAAQNLGRAAAAGAVVSALVGLAYRTLLVPVIQAADLERAPFPLLTGHAGALGGWWLAIPTGVGLGALSAVAFWALGVTESELLQQQQAWFPGIDHESASIVFGVGLPTMLAAAVSEELVFRGVLQRWLVRWLGGSWGAVVVAIAISSVAWAAGHAANTDVLWLKLGQILLLGGLFGGLAQRWSVEASIVAHMAFNAAVVVVAFALAALP